MSIIRTVAIPLFLLCILSGCKSSREEALEQQVDELESQLADVRSKLSEVESAVDDLSSAVDEFGYQNWRIAVNDVTYAFIDVESAVSDAVNAAN